MLCLLERVCARRATHNTNSSPPTTHNAIAQSGNPGASPLLLPLVAASELEAEEEGESEVTVVLASAMGSKVGADVKVVDSSAEVAAEAEEQEAVFGELHATLGAHVYSVF